MNLNTKHESWKLRSLPGFQMTGLPNKAYISATKVMKHNLPVVSLGAWGKINNEPV